MTRFALVLFVFLSAASPLHGEAPKPRPQRETWYEQVLRHINPDNTDYGAMWEQRKRAFLAQLGNPYFQYSFAATAALVFLLTVAFVQHVSHTRALEVAAQSIADVLRHDEYSRQVEREAIKRYNDHIEACNRMSEAEQARETTFFAERDALNGELEAAREEGTRLKEELEARSAMIAEKAVRSGTEASELAAIPSVPQNLIERINQLELVLKEERKKNLRLKGTALDARNT